MTARLVDTPLGKGLVDDDAPELSPLVIDLAHGRKLRGDDDLIKALGREKGSVSVVDATAGIGRDAIAIKNAGFVVTAIERSPLVQELWRDALSRHAPRGLTFVAEDAVAWLDRVVGSAAAPDVVFVDPMYPHDVNRRALQQRELRLLRAAAGDDLDADALFAAALRAARRRVVVKRPKQAPPLTTTTTATTTTATATTTTKPTLTFTGASTRFDVYLR